MIRAGEIIGALLLLVACGFALFWINRGGLIRLRAARGKAPRAPMSTTGKAITLGVAVIAIVAGVVLLVWR